MPKGGRGPATVYNTIVFHQNIHTMMEDISVVNSIIDFSRKGFLDGLCNCYATYLTEDWFSSHHNIELSNTSINNLYECLISNPNALKSKSKRKNFIKAYEEHRKSNESYLSRENIIIESYIKKYLQLII